MTNSDLIQDWERRLDLIQDDVVESLLLRRYIFRDVQGSPGPVPERCPSEFIDTI